MKKDNILTNQPNNKIFTYINSTDLPYQGWKISIRKGVGHS